MTDDGGKRKGLSSMLVVTYQECAHEENMHTSKVSGGAMDINRRMVLAMRLIGKGLQPLEQFCGVLNMTGSMKVKTYTGHVTALQKAAKEAKKSMTKVVNDIRHLYEVNPDGIVDTGVSSDGTWRKRGFSSFHGVATAISIVSGKTVLSFNHSATGVLRTLEGAGVRAVDRHTVVAVKKKDTRKTNIMQYMMLTLTLVLNTKKICTKEGKEVYSV